MKKALPYQIFMLFISVLSVGTVAVLSFGKGLDQSLIDLMQGFDLFFCAIFFSDFLYSFLKAERKLKYMKWGWIDLLASIPMVDFLRFGRSARIFRIIAILRALKSSRLLWKSFSLHKRKSSIYILTFISFLMIFISSVGILLIESHAPNANIKNAGDAIWWSLATITTVGYGDHYPITTGGRVLASIMMFVGIGIFSSLSGIFASFLVDKDGDGQVDIETDDIRRELEELKSMIKELKNDDHDEAA